MYGTGIPVPDQKEDLMNKNQNRTDITAEQGARFQTIVLTPGAGRCCPFLVRVRYHKTYSLKDEEIFNEFNGSHMEKKRKQHDEIEDNAGTSMMYYL